MNKTTLTTIILDAAIILAVTLFMFVIRPWDKANKKDQADYAPMPELSIAEQEGIEPVEPVVGNSKPVDVEPVEGIRITAPANAMDKDREFKITPVDEKTWDEADKKIVEVSGEKMLFCFDLDAGMEPEEHLPGEYTFSMDLEKMGIPPILHDRVRLWRMAGEELYEYTSWVENGKLVFKSDQNSVIITALGAFGGGLLLAYSRETWHKHNTTGDLYKSFFSLRDDALVHEIKDKNGDFTLYFRFKDTEDADRFEEYKISLQNYEKRRKELEALSETEYERQVNAKYDETREYWNTWQRIMGSAEAKRKAKEAVDKAAILAKMLEEDSDLNTYKAGMALPKSIQDLEEMLKQANAYLTDDQGLRPQTCNLEVDLITSGLSGEYRRTVSKLPYMVINYSKMLSGGSTYTRKGKGESMLITITHELFHHRQKTHNWPRWMDFRSEETTAAYLESCAADYYLKNGQMTTNVNHPAKGAEADFVRDNFDPAPRGYYEVFGRNFNSAINQVRGNHEWAYTYADLMDYIQEHKKLEPLKGSFIMNQYSYTSSHKTNYMKWFGITDEKELEKWIRLFCVDSLKRIKDRQEFVKNENPSLAIVSYFLTRKNPIKEAKTECDGLIMRTFYVECQNLKQEGPFNAFIVRGKDCTPDKVWFYASTDGFNKDKSDSTYFHSDKPTSYYTGAYFQAPSFLLSGLPFTIVALFQPEKPEVTKVKKDYIKFKVPTPEKSLLKNKYVTGMLYTLRDKNGNERNILAPAGKFGKEVKWKVDGVGDTDFALTACWIGEGDEALTYSSPESEPFVHGSVPSDVTASANAASDKKADKKKAKEEKKAEEKVVKHDSQEKLVEKVDFKENPFIVAGLDYEPPYYVSKQGDVGWVVVQCEIPFTDKNMRFEPTTDGYRLLLHYNGDMFNSLNSYEFPYPEQTHDITVELLLDEELELIAGTISHKADFTQNPYRRDKPDFRLPCQYELNSSVRVSSQWAGFSGYGLKQTYAWYVEGMGNTDNSYYKVYEMELSDVTGMETLGKISKKDQRGRPQEHYVEHYSPTLTSPDDGTPLFRRCQLTCIVKESYFQTLRDYEKRRNNLI